MISRIRRVRSHAIRAVQSNDNNATEAMKAHTKTFFSLRRWQWAVVRVSLPKMSRKGHVNRSNQPPSHPTTARYPVKGLNKKRVSIQNLRNKLALETFANVMFLREFRRLEWVRSQRKTKGPLRKHRSMDYKLSPQPLPSAVPSVTCSWCVRRIECVDVESDVHGALSHLFADAMHEGSQGLVPALVRGNQSEPLKIKQFINSVKSPPYNPHNATSAVFITH